MQLFMLSLFTCSRFFSPSSLSSFLSFHLASIHFFFIFIEFYLFRSLQYNGFVCVCARDRVLCHLKTVDSINSTSFCKHLNVRSMAKLYEKLMCESAMSRKMCRIRHLNKITSNSTSNIRLLFELIKLHFNTVYACDVRYAGLYFCHECCRCRCVIAVVILVIIIVVVLVVVIVFCCRRCWALFSSIFVIHIL